MTDRGHGRGLRGDRSNPQRLRCLDRVHQAAALSGRPPRRFSRTLCSGTKEQNGSACLSGRDPLTDSGELASIGPRSHDRGHSRDSPASGCGSKSRFNWAAVSRPRKRFGSTSGSTSSPCFNWAAVLRPQKLPGGRGEVARFLRASIGPRSCDRGNRTACQGNIDPLRRLQLGRGLATADTTAHQFPGPAPCWRLQLGRGLATAETVAPPQRLGGRLGRFNWAAVLRPRKLSRGTWQAPASRRLQLGRGLATAETVRRLRGLISLFGLQLGRGLATAETWGVRGAGQSRAGFNWAAVLRPRKHVEGGHIAHESPRLQLGRGLATAETTCGRTTDARTGAGFNWAAVLRPRKPAASATLEHSQATLQLGRGLATAETPVIDVVAIYAERLQLGRGLATAETHPPPCPLGRKPSGFNWAAVLRPRKLVHLTLPFVATGAASIGPRSCDRGNQSHPDVPALILTLLQLGRGLATAETLDAGPRPGELLPASIGPRSCDRGNRARPAGLPRAARGFNWAAVLRPRKPAHGQKPPKLRGRLQLGRGLATAETTHRRVSSAPVRRASIGPRSCDRGNPSVQASASNLSW